MKRLTALALAIIMLLGLAACTGGSGTGGNEVYNVGICQYSEHDSLALATQGFMEALATTLGTDRVIFDIQNAFGDGDICTTIINNFVSRNHDLILANSTQSLQAASAGTGEIPILGTSVTDYTAALGLDEFNGTVGGNISGTSDLAPLEEQAKMIIDLLPEAKKVGIIYCSSEANSIYQVGVVKAYLENKGLTVTEFPFVDTNDVASVTTVAAEKSDVIYIPTDNAAASTAQIIDSICRPAKIPVISGDAATCEKCAIATLGISYYHLGYRTGEMAVKILTGEKAVSEMPIEYADAVVYIYNKEICDELGITVPDTYKELTGKE